MIELVRAGGCGAGSRGGARSGARLHLALVAMVLSMPVAAAPGVVEDPGRARRIVSLAPNLTELVYAAGAGDRLVGADAFSDHPAAARRLPRVGDAFQVDYERLLALRPDLVLVWQTGTPERVIERLQRLDLRVERVAIANLADVADALRRIGAWAGTETQAERAAADYLRRLETLRASRRATAPVTVFYQISAQPLYTVNGRHPISEVIELCGGRNIFAELPQFAPPVSLEAVLERDPQIILTATGAQGDPLAVWRRWPQLRAVRDGRLYTVQADWLARATPRILDGAREVCAMLDKARSDR